MSILAATARFRTAGERLRTAGCEALRRCGTPTSGSRCLVHTLRNGSTRSWRNVRAIVLPRDGYRCQLCGQAATEVDHVLPVADGDSDEPSNTRALYHAFHAGR